VNWTEKLRTEILKKTKAYFASMYPAKRKTIFGREIADFVCRARV